jgi:hypothetical protein
MMPIGDILSSLLNKKNLSGEGEASRVLQKCSHLLEEFLGEKTTNFLTPKIFRNGIIFVESFSGAWSNRLLLEKYRILQSLSEVFPEKEIKDIVIRMARDFSSHAHSLDQEISDRNSLT